MTTIANFPEATSVGQSDKIPVYQSSTTKFATALTIFGAAPPIGGTTPNTGAFTTLSASGIFTASSDSYFSGVLYGSGNWSFSPPVANGKFVLQSATADGAMLYGRGSTNDVSIYNRDGSVGLFFRTADISIGATDFLPNADNTTTLGSASYRFKNAFFSGQVKGGAGTGTGAPVMIGTLEVNTTSDGNTGLSTDSPLQTKYPLPANSLSSGSKGIRITHWGTGAANANTKTLTAFFGTTRLIEAASTSANALSWKIVVHVFRTGANTQLYQAELTIYGTAIEAHLVTNGTCAETDTSAIDLWAAGTSINTNDLVQKCRLIEFIN